MSFQFLPYATSPAKRDQVLFIFKHFTGKTASRFLVKRLTILPHDRSCCYLRSRLAEKQGQLLKIFYRIRFSDF